MAFAIRPNRSPDVEVVLRTHGLVDRRFAVFTVRTSPYGAGHHDGRLVRELTGAVVALLKAEIVEKVAVVVHTSGPTEVENDAPPSALLVREVVSVIGPAQVCLIDADLSPAELSALYGAARLVVGERLHSVILALCAGTPAFAISYFSTKAPGVMALCGLDELHCDVDEVTAGRILQAATKMCDPELRATIRDRVDILAEMALEAVA
jgi:polysaccharide pyruvyl transferase WcaK-like protein